MVKWQDTEHLHNKGIRLKLGYEKCESVRQWSGFLQFIKVFQMNFAHMETELNKDVKGAPYIQ